jgi:hypothetical protein
MRVRREMLGEGGRRGGARLGEKGGEKSERGRVAKTDANRGKRDLQVQVESGKRQESKRAREQEGKRARGQEGRRQEAGGKCMHRFPCHASILLALLWLLSLGQLRGPVALTFRHSKSAYLGTVVGDRL